MTPSEILERYQAGGLAPQTAIALLREHAAVCPACASIIYRDYIPGIAIYLFSPRP